jgi:hypothetical protein
MVGQSRTVIFTILQRVSMQYITKRTPPPPQKKKYNVMYPVDARELTVKIPPVYTK